MAILKVFHDFHDILLTSEEFSNEFYGEREISKFKKNYSMVFQYSEACNEKRLSTVD